MENKTDRELLDWYLRHPEEEAEERRVFLGLYAHKRRAMAEKWIDELAAAETAETTSRRRAIVWPWWVGAAAIAACMLLLLLPREAAPVEMAQVDPRPIVEPRPQPVERGGASPTAKGSDISGISNGWEEESPIPQSECVAEEAGHAPSLQEVAIPESIVPEPETPAEPEVLYYASASLVEYDDDNSPSHASVAPRRGLTLALGGQVVNDTLSPRFEGFTICSI